MKKITSIIIILNLMFYTYKAHSFLPSWYNLDMLEKETSALEDNIASAHYGRFNPYVLYTGHACHKPKELPIPSRPRIKSWSIERKVEYVAHTICNDYVFPSIGNQVNLNGYDERKCINFIKPGVMGYCNKYHPQSQ